MRLLQIGQLHQYSRWTDQYVRPGPQELPLLRHRSRSRYPLACSLPRETFLEFWIWLARGRVMTHTYSFYTSTSWKWPRFQACTQIGRQPHRTSCNKKFISERKHKAVATRFVILNAAGNTSVNVPFSLLFHGAERGSSKTQLQQHLTLHESGPQD